MLLLHEINDVDKEQLQSSVAYLKCAKGGGPGDEVPQKLTLFCY